MTGYSIPFNRPSFTGNEQRYIAEAIASGKISGDGSFTRRCQEWFEREIGVHRAFLTTSCTHALEMAAILLSIEPGDEVLVPSFTFVSTVNAFVLCGARPVFVDIKPDTLNLDEGQIERHLGPRTRAIVAVHYAGVACAMETIGRLARGHSVAVVEDNAHGLFGRYRGQSLGTFGQVATLSFHETKNVTCGEGGALLVNDPALVERAEIIREKGTNRSRFFRSQVDKYTWIDVGSSWVPSDVLAAFLFAQLEESGTIQAARRHVWDTYAASLSDWAASGGVRLPVVPRDCEQPAHLFYLLMPDLDSRQRLIDHLARRGILAVFHYVPLHSSPFGRRFGNEPGDCPVSEDVSSRLVRLPLYNDLPEADLWRVIEAVRQFRP